MSNVEYLKFTKNKYRDGKNILYYDIKKFEKSLEFVASIGPPSSSILDSRGNQI